MTPERPQVQSVTDLIDAPRAAALHATLDRPGPPPGPGDPLPNFWHQCWFWSPVATSGLGYDGHPPLGGLIPDLGLKQRMWAGGDLTFHAPLTIGSLAQKTSTVESTATKTGRSGRLAFVTLRHEIRQDGRLCITEMQDLVYRDPPEDRVATAPPQARQDEESSRPATFPTPLLFRYSALTFNGHRIHYDLDFCRSEGHPGLVVHGPLLAQSLIAFAEADLGPLARFTFRATAPLYHFKTATLCRAGTALWIRGPDGRQNMTAEAVPVTAT